MNELMCHEKFSNDINIINKNMHEELALFNRDSNDFKLKPWYITGLTDGEGSFQITIQVMKGKGLTGLNLFLNLKLLKKSIHLNY